MRVTYWQTDLTGQDFRAVDLTEGYFGECVLTGARFAAIPGTAFYKCTGAINLSECPDLLAGYFRQNIFLGLLLPPSPTYAVHDLVASYLRTRAQPMTPLLRTFWGKVANRIQSRYDLSWPDFVAYAKTLTSRPTLISRTQVILAAQPGWLARFTEVV